MTTWEKAKRTPAEVYDSTRRLPAALEELAGLQRYRFLITQLIARSIKTRYKRSFLGVAWTMVNPLLTMLVLTVVFSRIFQFKAGEYALHVLSGLLMWNFFAQSSVAAMGDLMWSGGLISRIFLPKSSFAVAAVGTGLVNLLLALIPYSLITLLLGQPLQPTMWALPFAIMATAAFTLGVALLVSSLSVYFQDVMPMFEVILTAWMYLTPVIYPVDILPANLQVLLRWNPMYWHVEAFRGILLVGVLPRSEVMVFAFLTGLLALLVGWWAFTRRSRDFAYRI
jgi:ABC-type polysaccharide/polyol phosphate export permease